MARKACSNMTYRHTAVHYEFAAQDKLNTNIITIIPTAFAGICAVK
jgi:hypothetical protein